MYNFFTFHQSIVYSLGNMYSSSPNFHKNLTNVMSDLICTYMSSRWFTFFKVWFFRKCSQVTQNTKSVNFYWWCILFTLIENVYCNAAMNANESMFIT